MDCSSTSKICELKNPESEMAGQRAIMDCSSTSKICELKNPESEMAAVCRGKTPNYLDSPWLMTFLQRDNRGLVESIDSSSSKAYNLLLREVSYTWVLSASHGWLLLCRDDLLFFFFNPVTRQIKYLPPLELPGRSEPSCFKAAFSSSPASLDCTVVVISVNCNQFRIWHQGSEHWTPHCLSDGILLPTDAHQPFFCGGILWCMYYKGRNAHAFMIDPAEERSMVYNILILYRLRGWESLYMTGFEGELFLILVRGHKSMVRGSGDLVHVFKLRRSLNLLTLSEEIESLGDRTVYLGSRMALMAISRVGGMENRIYFPKFERMESYLGYYSMETRKYDGTVDFLEIPGHIKMLQAGHNTYIEQIWVEPNDSLA